MDWPRKLRDEKRFHCSHGPFQTYLPKVRTHGGASVSRQSPRHVGTHMPGNPVRVAARGKYRKSRGSTTNSPAMAPPLAGRSVSLIRTAPLPRRLYGLMRQSVRHGGEPWPGSLSHSYAFPCKSHPPQPDLILRACGYPHAAGSVSRQSPRQR